ncbi:MAG: hypothetical protein WD335_03210 [Candidatus Paceibacterota bacterium]
MQKTSLLFVIPIIAGLMVASYAVAQDSATVAATVQFQNISVSVADGAIDYGVLSASTTEDTQTLGDQQTATNDGNTTIDLNIQGQNAASGSGTDWTLAATPAADQYVHKFSTDTGSSWTALTTSYQTLATAIASSGTQTFDLEITTPTSSTDTDQKNADVTVQAVAN